ncbi:HdeA/HdeB family chaperone [Microbulbifer spongiae]|uniref:HdeA family protein n=1 Tax=Microbulbifer spongiae TaxID=2944933 RepID=A0ABY9EBD5_9GAMM|nr:HdeA/HdeB family chaperone [Microbulbifer sp. MI-G]WKD49261.1 HdeA family protein [Microbulbifer sp. MI-G]
MRVKTLLVALLAFSFSAGAVAEKKDDKKDHPYLNITCSQFIDYDPEDFVRVYYWYDAYSWFTWNKPLIEEDDYVDWHANMITYCKNNKGDTVYEAIEELY